MTGAPIKPHAARPGENHDRDRIILERLNAGVTARAVAAEFSITHQRVSQIKQRLTGARPGAARRPWSLDRIGSERKALALQALQPLQRLVEHQAKRKRGLDGYCRIDRLTATLSSRRSVP